jgi:hypothetical protein
LLKTQLDSMPKGPKIDHLGLFYLNVEKTRFELMQQLKKDHQGLQKGKMLKTHQDFLQKQAFQETMMKTHQTSEVVKSEGPESGSRVSLRWVSTADPNALF